LPQINECLGRSAPFVKVLPIPIIAQRAPATTDTNYAKGQPWIDESVIPSILYFHLGGGDWNSNELTLSTDATFAGALNTTASSSLAIKTYADNLAIAGSPVSTETTPGIGELATDVEAVAGTPSTGALALFVTPSNLAAVFAAPPAIGGTTPSSGEFTNISATGVGTGNILTSDTDSSFSTTGAGIDVTIDSDAGRVIINGEEAAANAITLLSAAGGIDVDAALQVNIASSENSVDAIRILASAGGIDIDAVGAATEDINITNTGGSIVLSSTESAADSIVIQSTAGGIDILANGAAAGEDIDISTSASVNITSTENNSGAVIVRANGGASERVTLLASQGTGADSINLESTAGGITLSAALASADAINLSASAGGVDIDGALQVNIASSQNAADAIRIVASAGGIDIDAVGAAAEDINITNTGGSITLQATESDIDAIVINASGAAGGINVDAGTSGVIVDTTGGISLDSAAASNFTATGAFDITVSSTAGSLLFNAGEAAADAFNFDAAAGGLDVDVALQLNLDSSQAATADSIRIVASAADGGMDLDAGTGGMTLDSTGAISIDAAAASNFSVSGAGIDLTLASSAGRVVMNGEEAAADALRLLSAAGGLDADVALQMNLVSSQNAADAIVINASAGGIDVTAAGAAGEDIDIVCTSGSINLTAGENIATSMVITNTGMDIDITGAAGQDFDLTNTGGSVNITATENVSDAIVINASGAASGMSLDAGTSGLTIGTGMILPVTAVATADTPYALLGTDYIVSTDTTGGVLTITLPADPATGRTVVIYDGAGQAAIGGNITIDGNGNNIAAGGTSAASKLINTAFESYTLYFNGTIWLGQNIV